MNRGEIRNFLGGWGWLGHYFGWMGVGRGVWGINLGGWRLVEKHFGWLGVGAKIFWVGGSGWGIILGS